MPRASKHHFCLLSHRHCRLCERSIARNAGKCSAASIAAAQISVISFPANSSVSRSGNRLERANSMIPGSPTPTPRNRREVIRQVSLNRPSAPTPAFTKGEPHTSNRVNPENHDAWERAVAPAGPIPESRSGRTSGQLGVLPSSEPVSAPCITNRFTPQTQIPDIVETSRLEATDQGGDRA